MLRNRIMILFLAAAYSLACLVPAAPLYADMPESPPQGQYLALVDSMYLGGSLSGYGKAQSLSVTSMPGRSTTTDSSVDGVNFLPLMNLGPNDVYLSMNDTAVSTANRNLILPAGMAFPYLGKSKTVALRYYCPTGTATVITAW